MDRYAYLLEHLRRDNYRRLRNFVADGRGEFSTWLVIVAQRLCLDHHRQRYGRARAPLCDRPLHDEERRARRRLIDLVSAESDLDRLKDGSTPSPEDELHATEAHGALLSVLERLAPRDRLLVRLRFEDELPMPEVARILGFPTRFHVYRRLTAVLAVLRRELEKAGIEEPVRSLAPAREMSVSPKLNEPIVHDDP
jgi:RNA polymerase sigma factor (sigma-70 family)